MLSLFVVWSSVVDFVVLCVGVMMCWNVWSGVL